MRLINADSIMRKMVNMLIESGNLYLAGKAAALIDCEPTVKENLTPMEVREQATAILMRIAPIEAPELLEKYFGIENGEDGLDRWR